MLHRRGDGAELSGHGWIFCGELVEFADFDVGRHHARPLGARAQEPPAAADELKNNSIRLVMHTN
jgi:hypothetical protein